MVETPYRVVGLRLPRTIPSSPATSRDFGGVKKERPVYPFSVRLIFGQIRLFPSIQDWKTEHRRCGVLGKDGLRSVGEVF